MLLGSSDGWFDGDWEGFNDGILDGSVGLPMADSMEIAMACSTGQLRVFSRDHLMVD